MRLLLCTPFAPDPGAAHGGGAYLGTFAGALAKQCELALVCLSDPEADASQRLRHIYAELHAVPRQERPTGRGRRRYQAQMLWRWRRLPLVAAKAWQPEFARTLQRVCETFQPDAVLVELAQMAQYLPGLQGLPTVFTDHEAGCPANTHTGLGAWADARDRRLWRRYVHRFYPQATLLQALTAEDAGELAAALGREVVVRSPVFPVPSHRVAPELTPPRALFLGDFRHAPNEDAARRLATAVLPRLRAAMADAELWLVGPHDACLADLDGVPGLRRLGFQRDLLFVFAQVRLLLAPVWSGAGFRVKTVTALSHGLPVVTNQLGARGITAPAGARALAESDAELAEAALRWLRDPAAAASAGALAHLWAREQAGTASKIAAEQLARCAALQRRA